MRKHWQKIWVFNLKLYPIKKINEQMLEGLLRHIFNGSEAGIGGGESYKREFEEIFSWQQPISRVPLLLKYGE